MNFLIFAGEIALIRTSREAFKFDDQMRISENRSKTVEYPVSDACEKN